MNKKISIGTKPSSLTPPTAKATDAWVGERTALPPVAEKTKRLTLDIPASLHSRIKSACAFKDTKMVEEITELLMKHFPE